MAKKSNLNNIRLANIAKVDNVFIRSDIDELNEKPKFPLVNFLLKQNLIFSY